MKLSKDGKDDRFISEILDFLVDRFGQLFTGLLLRGVRHRCLREVRAELFSELCYCHGSACTKSSIKSSGCSKPTDNRNKFFGDVEAGPSADARCSIRLSTPPRLVAG